MIDIIEGQKEEFVKQMNELEKKNIYGVPETFRVFEFCGKMFYTVMVAEGEKKEKKK